MCAYVPVYMYLFLHMYVDESPALRQLQYLKGNSKAVMFMKAVEGDWIRLAHLLGLGESVDAINNYTSFRKSVACRQVMLIWLKGAHRTPVTWATLLKALDEMERPDIKKDLETALGLKISHTLDLTGEEYYSVRMYVCILISEDQRRRWPM